MREGLGDNAYLQPRQLREQVHLRRLKIKQTGGQTRPVKQNHELPVGREGRGKPQAGRASTPIFFVVVSMGWLVDVFVVGQIAAMKRKNSRLFPAKQMGVPLMIHQRRTPERGVKMPTPHKSQFSSCTRFLSLHSHKYLSVKTEAFVFIPQKFRSLLCALAAQTFLALPDGCIAVALRVATAVLGKERRCVSRPQSCMQCAHHQLRGFVVAEDIHLLHLWPSTLSDWFHVHPPREEFNFSVSCMELSPKWSSSLKSTSDSLIADRF